MDFRGTFANSKDPQQSSVREELICRKGRGVFSALEMKYPTCVFLSLVGLLTVAVIPLSLGEMYTSLLNVKQAISVERKLIDYLKTYIDRELERLEDIQR